MSRISEISSMVEYSSTSHIARGGLLAIHSKRMAKSGTFVYCGLRMRLVSGHPWPSCFAHANGPSKQTMTYYISVILT